MARYKATKEGWDGRRIIKPGEIFNFDGPRGSWMVPCDGAGNPLEGEALPPEQRPFRAGAKMPANLSREALREKCKALGIQFKATLGGPALAELIRKHEEEAETQLMKESGAGKSSENPDGGAPGVGTEGQQGTGNLEVL
jgi:hypothetical protein